MNLNKIIATLSVIVAEKNDFIQILNQNHTVYAKETVTFHHGEIL